jgi:DNA-directed RNA polymerase I, II, and III subunit RPABC1
MNNKEYISRSLKTIMEMLQDRKVDVSTIKDGLSTIVDTNHNKATFDVIIDKIKIMYYLPPSKFKWGEVKKSFEDDENQYDLIIFIVKEKVSQNNLKLIHSLGLHIQIFEIKELQFNISKHVLVPKHEVVDEQEVKSIVERYTIKSKFQLPHILKNDPMSRYLGLKSGDVVRITRTSPTAGEYIIYRCCL